MIIDRKPDKDICLVVDMDSNCHILSFSLFSYMLLFFITIRIFLFHCSLIDVERKTNRLFHLSILCSPDNTGNAMEKDDSDNSKSDEEEANEMPENYNYSRRRSRAVLYHISGQLNKQNKAKSKLQQLNRVSSHHTPS